MASNFQKWDKPAHQLWEANEKLNAIQKVFNAINQFKIAKKEAHVELFEQAYFYLYFFNDYHGALTMIEKVLEYKPKNLETLQNHIVCLNRVGKYTEAIISANKYLSLNPNNPMIYDVLAVAYIETNDESKATQAANHSLYLKHQQALSNLPNQSIKKTIHTAKKIGAEKYIASQPERTRHVISFSLFGNQDKYLNGGIRNLMLMHDIYPNWEIWIYHDSSVPKSYLKLYENMGAKLIKKSDNATLKEKLTWRFLVANHPEVARFLVRDIDSVINIRERHAVDDWLTSDRLFHVIRDWWTHTELILAGMWGGIAGLLPDFLEEIQSYSKVSAHVANTHDDQHFLRKHMWQYIVEDVSQHDRFFALEDEAYDLKSTNPWVNMLNYDKKLNVTTQNIGSCEGSKKYKAIQEKHVKPYLEYMKLLNY